jgi:protocatechuate 3,4-dioxygenase beta subunit
MNGDDSPMGRVLSRREAAKLLRSAGAAWLAASLGVPGSATAAQASGCVVRPQQTEGPFFVDESLDRSDIRADPASGRVVKGTPLALTFVVSRVAREKCEPLPRAQVDLWHCDPDGVYSDVDDAVGLKFLRGHQLTDARGHARFVTIYPGWYSSRAVHIHFKIRTPGDERRFEFTSQLYFDDALTDRVHATAPYAARGQRKRRNADDSLFRRDGEDLLLAPQGSVSDLEASFAIALQS